MKKNFVIIDKKKNQNLSNLINKKINISLKFLLSFEFIFLKILGSTTLFNQIKRGVGVSKSFD